MTDGTTVRRFDIPRVERVLEGPGALAAIAFNSRPDDGADAARRWLTGA